MLLKIEDPFLGDVVGIGKVYGKSPYPVEVLEAFKRKVFQS